MTPPILADKLQQPYVKITRPITVNACCTFQSCLHGCLRSVGISVESVFPSSRLFATSGKMTTISFATPRVKITMSMLLLYVQK